MFDWLHRVPRKLPQRVIEQARTSWLALVCTHAIRFRYSVRFAIVRAALGLTALRRQVAPMSDEDEILGRLDGEPSLDVVVAANVDEPPRKRRRRKDNPCSGVGPPIVVAILGHPKGRWRDQCRVVGPCSTDVAFIERRRADCDLCSLEDLPCAEVNSLLGFVVMREWRFVRLAGERALSTERQELAIMKGLLARYHRQVKFLGLRCV